jgi:hypothetical protein
VEKVGNRGEIERIFNNLLDRMVPRRGQGFEDKKASKIN